MPRTATKPAPGTAIVRTGPPTLVDLLTKAAVSSVQQTDEVVAMLDELRRCSPRDYIAALVMIAKLGQEIPAHTPQFTVISAIPRSRLDDLPPHMEKEVH